MTPHNTTSTGIQVNGTALTEEETAAVLTVVNTQLVEVPTPEPPVDYSTRDRVVSAWTTVTAWQSPPHGA